MERKKRQTMKMVAVIFTESEQKIFNEYRDTFGFANSSDAYRALIDLVDEKWTGIQLKNDQRFSIRLSMEDYNELERVREKLGGVSRSEALRRGVDFLHGVISDDKELSKWKEFAAGIPRFLRTGKKKENGLINGKTVIYSMNDLSRQVLRDICDAFEENRTGIMRLALEAMKVLPPEKLAKKEEKKIHSTVRLREEEYGRLEALKARLNYNGNGIFRTGLFLANRELKERRMNRQSEPKCISLNSDLWRSGSFIPVDNVQQSVILRP